MKQEYLKQLHCPYCGSNFELTKKLDDVAGDIIHAIAECNCRGYPIVSGILTLNTLNLNALNEALGALREGDPRTAIFKLLEPTSNTSRIIQAAKSKGIPFSGGIEKLRSKLVQSYLEKFTHLDNFSLVVDYCRSISFGGYFKHRFSSSTFIAAVPLICLMQYLPGPVLEVGCGMGHHGFVISQLYPDRKLVLADASFVNLYLTKKFFAPHADCICLNANDPLPFKDASFGAVFASDSLHYLHSKKLAVEEIGRLYNSDNGAMLFSHLHNMERENPAAGEPLTASGWLDLVSFSKARLFPERQILKDFLNDDKLDLSREYSNDVIQEIDAFVLIAASSPGLFKLYQGIGGDFFNLREHLIVNPLYRMSLKEDQALLKKYWPTKYMRQENKDIDAFLPSTFFLDRQSSEKIAAGKFSQLDTSLVQQLQKKFILINAPISY